MLFAHDEINVQKNEKNGSINTKEAVRMYIIAKTPAQQAKFVKMQILVYAKQYMKF